MARSIQSIRNGLVDDMSGVLSDAEDTLKRASSETGDRARELRSQVGHARRQAEGQLLHGVGPGIVVDVGADSGRGHAHCVERRPAGQMGHLVVGLL